MDSVNSNMIGNLISSIVAQRFNLDPMYSVLITTLVSSYLIKATLPSFSTAYICYSLVFLITLAGFLVYYLWPRKHDSKYTQIRTYRWEDINVVRFMMTKHPEFYTKEYDMVIGNPEARQLEDLVLPDDDKIEFNDKIHDVKGYITAEYNDTTTTTTNSAQEKISKKNFYLVLAVEKGGKYNCYQYLAEMEKHKKAITEQEDEMELFMVKVMGKTDRSGNREDSCHHEITMYDGPSENHDERYEKYMKSYFSKHRDELWTYISNVHFHPEKFSIFGQEARCNLLIYGPPGSGKSTFVYRLAMALGRHIVSVDITALSHDRTEVYKVIQKPMINEYFCEPKEFIVLLEEFDITVKHLKEKNQRPDINSFLKAKYSPKEKKEDNGIVLPPLYSRSTREFELEDLLEILQGPVPIKQSIIIATTNKYDEIREMCPALFRPGRLTPIKFDYMNWESLQNMSQYYFKRPLTLEKQHEINIPTSEIVELALNASLYNSGFDKFQSELKEKLS